MSENGKINKFQELISKLKDSVKFDLIDIVDKENKGELRKIIITVLETGDIRNLDYEFDGGNINLSYKSVEELVYSLELRREYPIINLYKATGSLNPLVIYRVGQSLNYDTEEKALVFDNNGELIKFAIKDNKYTTAIEACTVMSKFKLSPDPCILIDILNNLGNNYFNNSFL